VFSFGGVLAWSWSLIEMLFSISSGWLFGQMGFDEFGSWKVLFMI
jgi:hypothetical protein